MAKKRQKISTPKKKTTNPKKKKGVSSYNKVRKYLWSKYKHEFASYQDFMRNDIDESGKSIPKSSIASKVYNELKSKGKGYPQNSIDAAYKRYKKENQRFLTAEEINERLSSLLDYNLLEPNDYWEIGEEAVWDIIPTEVYVDASRILPEPNYMAALKFHGEAGFRHRDRFNDWIRHLNQLQVEGRWGHSTVYPAFMFTPVEWDKELNSWFTTLLSVTSSGDEEDWGWSPEMGGHDIEPMPDVYDFADDISDIDKDIADLEKILGQGAPPSKATEAELKAQIALEKEKQKTLKAKTKSTKEFNEAVKNIQSLLKDGLIDAKTAKQMLKDLRP